MAEHYQAKLVVLHIVEEWRHPLADFAGSAADLTDVAETSRTPNLSLSISQRRTIEPCQDISCSRDACHSPWSAVHGKA